MARCACHSIGIVGECCSMSDNFSLNCVWSHRQFYTRTPFSYFIIQIAWSSPKLKTEGISLEKFFPWKFDMSFSLFAFPVPCLPLSALPSSPQFSPNPSRLCLCAAVASRERETAVCRFCVALAWSCSGRPLQGLPVRLCKWTLTQFLKTGLFLGHFG